METNIKTDSTVIKRVVKEAKYAQIDNDLINNRELSFKALGIMTYILSKPDDWQIYISDLCRDKDGEKSVRAGLNELKDKKYISIVGTLSVNEFRNQKSINFIIKDIV